MILKTLDKELDELREQHSFRTRRVLNSPCAGRIEFDGKTFINFGSNDYLGLANNPDLISAAKNAAEKWGVGAGSSHLVGGHMLPHKILEENLASFVGFEDALYFSTGMMANMGVIPALLGRNDAVFADRLNHASLIDSAQLSRAQHNRYPHKDLNVLENMLKNSKATKKMIVTDAVFSMDGDCAPLPEILALAEKYDAWLMIDDAHGFGVLGKGGRGSLSHFSITPNPRIIYIGTLGKAAGVSGAFVAGTKQLVDYLIQRARTYIFTTASSPIIASALIESLKLIENGNHLRERLKKNISKFRTALSDILGGTDWKLLDSETAIQPVIIGSNDKAMKVAQSLYERGIWTPAIRPPTVPKDTARLRISLSAAHSDEDIERLTDALKAML